MEIEIVAAIVLNRLASFILSFLIKFNMDTVDTTTVRIKNSVIPCKVSTKVKEDDSGSDDSIIYLLPITANKAPTLNPKRESM